MTERDFVAPPDLGIPVSGHTRWRAPSNIALIKYWGKKDKQLPANPSLSFTLDNSTSTTSLSYRRLDKKAGGFSFEIFLDGKPEPAFRPKIQSFFDRILPYLPFLREYHFKIETANSFPHSSGIASSASGLAALALCLAELQREWISSRGEGFFYKWASFIARLGSGSASRSIQGPVMEWGQDANTEGSSDLYAIPYPFEIHGSFQNYQDTILLVDRGRKEVSSTLGHGLMHGHPFAESRFEQAYKDLELLKDAFRTGDLGAFAQIVEREALSLHAMMMTSNPYFILMKPNTLEIISQIKSFRDHTNLPLCFTLDAGANVHLLYPEGVKQEVFAFIKERLIAFCENGQYICDQIGFGAKKM